MPSATVVICTHNRAHLLGAAVAHALAEVRSCDAELLVVDNASVDETPRVLAQLAATSGQTLRQASEPQLGLSAARNCGLAEARGEIVAFLDDDAAPRPGWLRALISPYAAGEVAGTGGRIALRFTGPPPP